MLTMLLRTGSNATTYFAFHCSAEKKECNNHNQADIFQMFKQACRAQTNSPVIFKRAAG